MKKLLAQVAPGGKYEPAKIGTYVDNFKKVVVTDPKAAFWEDPPCQDEDLQHIVTKERG